MANIYSDMGRFLQESFSIDDIFKKSTRKHLNESRDYPSEWLTDADIFDDGQTIVAKKNIPYDDIDSVQEILDEDEINKIFKIKDDMAIIPKGTVAKLVMLNGPSGGWPEIEINGVQILFAGDLKPWFANIQVSESLKEAYETDVDLPYDPDAPYNVDESLNEEFEISVRSRFTPQKLKVLVNKAINNSGFPIEDIDKIEWLPGKLFETKDVIYILLKDNTEIPIVLSENNIENSIITALHRVLKYDKKYAK